MYLEGGGAGGEGEESCDSFKETRKVESNVAEAAKREREREREKESETARESISL